MTVHVKNLSVALLHTLIFDYTHYTKELISEGKPDFVDILSDFDYEKPPEPQVKKVEAFISYATTNLDFLDQKESEFLKVHADNGLVLPGLDVYLESTFWGAVFKTAIKNVNKGFKEYRDKMMAGTKESLWDEAHSNDVAKQIHYFFDTLEDTCLVTANEMATVVSAAQRETFFSEIFGFALAAGDNFDVTNSKTTADDVVLYCKNVEITAEQMASTIDTADLEGHTKIAGNGAQD